MQLTSHNNILELLALILVVVALSTNCSLIKGINIFFGELKFDYDISSQSLNLILDLDLMLATSLDMGLLHMKICNVFRFWRPIIMSPILKNEL